MLLLSVLFFNLIGVDSKLLGNVSLPGYDFFFFYRVRVMGEKEDSVLFTCCLLKESLAWDKKRFQTLSMLVCA